MSTRRDFLKYSAAASAIGLLPFSMKAPAAVKSGGSLSVAIFADPLTFDPHLAGNLQGRATTQAIHDMLLTVDKDGRLAPNLAQSWEWKDGKTIVMKLREGVKFHDDTDFDAEAVRYNIERIRNPDTGSIRGGEIGTLDTVEVVDSHTIKLTLKNAFAAFLFPLIDVSGCIASPTALKKMGQGLRAASGRHRPVQGCRVPQGRPVGAGEERRLPEQGQAGRGPAHPAAHSRRQHPARGAAVRRRPVRGILASPGHPEELGVKVEIEQTDSAGYRSTLRGGKMPIDLQGWWGYRPDPDQYPYILLHSTGSYAKRHGYSNPEMDKILDGERAAQSEAERRTVFRKLADLMNEDAVYVPWHYSSDFKGHHPNVKGVVHYQDSIIRYERSASGELRDLATLSYRNERAGGRALSGRWPFYSEEDRVMPVVRVSFYEGRSSEQKREIAEVITDALVRIAGSKREAVNVLFDNHAREDWVIGGAPELAKSAESG